MYKYNRKTANYTNSLEFAEHLWFCRRRKGEV